MSLERFMIALDDPNRTYSPGEVVAGKIFFDVRRRKIRVRALKVRIKGIARVKWADSPESEHPTYYGGEEQYFREELYVQGDSGDENVAIESGCHVLPFQFRLPINIPSSFESIHGSVCYTIRAKLERPLKTNCQMTIPFNVATPLVLGPSTAGMTAINDELEYKFSRFNFFNVGAMTVNVFVPSNCFAIGEDIEATIDISNTSSSVDVETIELELKQNITFISPPPNSRTKSHTEIVQSARNVGPFGQTDKTIVSMRVPSVPNSGMIHYCSLIDIVYTLKIIVTVSGGHKNFEKEYPITIGTRTALPVDEAPESAAAISLPENSATISMPEDSAAISMPEDSAAISVPAPTAPYIPDESSEAADATPMPMPMPMPISANTTPVPMPMPMPMPYAPAYGEKSAESTSNEWKPAHVAVNARWYPMGSAPYPTGGAPYPTGTTPYPSENTSHPTGTTPYPTGNTPYPPINSGPIGFVAPSPAPTSSTNNPDAPPSYSEAMAMSRRN